LEDVEIDFKEKFVDELVDFAWLGMIIKQSPAIKLRT